MGTQSRFTFFWQQGSPFSQWHPCVFEVEGVRYTCAEQYMMAGKARLFGDTRVLEQVLRAATPKQHKALGRKVSPFDAGLWERERERIVYEGNHAKFTQHPSLLNALLATAGTELVEASPMDRIWGVGLSAEDPRIQDPATWRGMNLLGKVLTRLREDLIAQGHTPVRQH
ncbi:NADAR family protein [Corallococcus sp. bb12-1]|uniref:NADAR family protein n=1 Tax=Corallococcus sp. bb12-1 TaxID=2996784 RepID=UPI0022715E03|nr:NADAR family protein [Corallococcus sp. bb12-1]MCY1046096.1 NADAR family protein [Corallococcus sp. bb12-1]